MQSNTARLLISCPDQRGIIAAVAGFMAEHDGNIVEADQHSDPLQRTFFMRIEIETGSLSLGPDTFSQAWQPVAERFSMRWKLRWGDHVKRMALLCTKESHCFSDLLWRQEAGELRVDIPLVVSNHEHLRPLAEARGIPYYHLPVAKDNKQGQEQAIVNLLAEHGVSFIVLARYMQILSPGLVSRFPEHIINIHHSFLPAFAGPKPYHQAYERGVKLIGATSHYVTDELDAGPIIAQSTLQIGHRDTIEDLIRKGRDLERIVLARAVRQHVEDKVLVAGRRTVVFD